MKYLITFFLLIISAVASRAQMLDPKLESLMSENARTVSRIRKLKAQGVKPHQIKPDIDTMSIRKSMEVSFNENGTVRSLVVIAELAEGASLPYDELERLDIRVSMHCGSFAILNVPGEALDRLAQMKAFSNLYASGIVKASNDKAREATSVSYVTGEKECNQISSNYTGEGVVIGVIDQGVDFNHAAFIDPKTGQTRIKEAVYFDNSGMRVVDDADSIATLKAKTSQTSHGTHTSATAAGSNVAGIGLQGMAPEAELVLCDLDDYLSESRIMQCVEEIFRYADSVGKPAVINISLGWNVGFHDGSAAIPKFVESKVGKGKIVCVSASNEGADKLSIGKTLGAADDDGYQLKTVCLPIRRTDGDNWQSYVNGIQIYIYADDTRDFAVDLKPVDLATGELYSFDEKPLCYVRTGSGMDMGIEIKKTTKTYCYINKSISYFRGDLGIAILVKGAEGQKITIVGNELDFCGAETYPALVGYDEGNADMSISIYACNDAVISVGSYVHRRAYKSINGRSYSNSSNKQVDRIATYSSYGVDDNGVARPDFLTPGMWMVSACSLYDNTLFINQNLNEKAPDYTSITNWYTPEELGANYTRPSAYCAMPGTSMSCPVATGIVALWLQANPNLTPADVREIARNTCLNDKWTTDVSNIPSGNIVQAGMGKLDALRGIKYIENKKAGEEICKLDETITFNNGIATYSSDKALNFNASTAPKAYIASSYEDGTLNLTRAGIVPEGTGLLLLDTEGGNGTYNVPIAPSASATELNYFVGTADSPVTIANEGEAYVLSKFNNVIGFYQNAANLTVPKNKAYLVLPDNGNGTNEIKAFAFKPDGGDDVDSEDDYIEIPDEELRLHSVKVIEDEPNDISPVNANAKDSSVIYNIHGQRVSDSFRGIIIKNGRKYVRL